MWPNIIMIIYSTPERRPLRALAINNIFSEKRCLTNKKVNLVQHQYNCVQICKPFTIEDIQSDAKSQEIEEELDGIQPMDENENLLRSIVNENEQLQNKMEETVKDIVKVNKKPEEMDVEDMHKKIYEENYALQQQIQILSTSLQLTRKVLTKDQLQALEAGYSKGFKWSKETILKALGLRFTCGTTGYNYIRKTVAPFPSVRTLQRSVENISFEPGLLKDIYFF